MAVLNRVVLVGRIVRNPELKKTPSGTAVTSFTVAVDNPTRSGGEKTTSFIPCTCWNKTAENVSKYCKQGLLVGVEGRLYQRSYNYNGQQRSSFEVVADNVQFLERKSDSSTGYNQQNTNNGEEDYAAADQEGIDGGDDQLPF